MVRARVHTFGTNLPSKHSFFLSLSTYMLCVYGLDLFLWKEFYCINGSHTNTQTDRER